MSHYCEKCKKILDDKEFYMSKDIEKYPPDGRFHMCKQCMTMHVDNWDPDTFKWILQEADVPYIKDEWNKLLKTWGKDPSKVTGVTIIGRYLSKMKLKQWNQYRWADTERLEQEILEKKIMQMKAQGLSEEDIAKEIQEGSDLQRPEMPAIQSAPAAQEKENAEASQAEPFIEDEEDDEIAKQLTDEDKTRLRIKWGRNYRADEWVRMEQLYEDMMHSYDIQGAGHKDTLIMICKASLKANQLIDAGDIEGFQKVSRVYDSLMKSGKFTAAQNKAESGEYVDSVGELVAICEKQGFIERFYVDEPKDSVDKTLLDLQQYTKTLVTEELNLGNMIDASIKQIMQDRENEKTIDTDAEDEEDSELFDYEVKELEDSDFEDYYEAMDKDGEF